MEYLLDLASEAGSVPKEELDDHPEVFEAIERHLKKRMYGVSLAEARERVRVDRERLWEWLKGHPADRYPETAPMFIVFGVLLYANRIFR